MPGKFVRRPDGSFSTIPADVVKTFNYVATTIDSIVFVADAPYKIVAIRHYPTTVGSDGGGVTLSVKKASGTTVLASGSAVHSGSGNMKATINTEQLLTLNTDGTVSLVKGDRIGVAFTGVTTAAVGFVQINLKRVQSSGADK